VEGNRIVTEAREADPCYYAFISYSRKDGKWAKWLHRAIEYYRLPSVVRKSRSEQGKALPRWIRPVFHDKSDLTPKGGLRVSLRRELEDSKYLIVICSPSSARPNSTGEHWVDEEIREFQRLGRNERIIPFIVEGQPNAATPEEECYPPALREQPDQALGVSVRESGRKDALLRVISVLLGLNFDELKQRHQARARRDRLLALAASLALALGLGWLYDANYREKTRYYADYVERRGVPEGIVELDAGEIAGRRGHYRIVKKGGRVMRLVHANPSGDPIPPDVIEGWLGRPTVALYENHDAKGLPLDVLYQDKTGKTVSYWRYTTDRLAVDLAHSKEDSSLPMVLSSEFFSDMNSYSNAKRGSISRLNFTYDDNGFVTTRLFIKGNWNDPVPDEDGVFGHVLTLDDMGRTTSVSYCNEKCKKPMDTSLGIAGLKYARDEKGNVVHTAYVNLDGKPTLGKMWFAAVKREYDERGNVIRWSFWGVNGQPTLHKNGYAAIKRDYDERGNDVKQSYFGLDGQVILLKDGYAAVEREYDERGNLVRRSFFGVDGKPTLHKYGDAVAKRDFDERGNLVRRSFFGVDGKPTLHKNGHAAVKMDYDERGNEVKRSYLGVDDQSTLHKNDHAAVKMDYDERENKIRRSFFGVDGQHTLSKDGFATVETDYDKHGNLVSRRFFGLNGELLKQTGVNE
jgi:hypothetical protein